MTAFLASVTTVEEALTAVRCGVDIVDCKDPAHGALGALPVARVEQIRASLPRTITVSATIGDLPAHPETIATAARAMAASGCDLIKIGFFPGGNPRATITALADVMAEVAPCRIVGLLLADRGPDLALVADMAKAGFTGVMLDTAGKSGGLGDHMSSAALSAFISSARRHGVFAGLAGSLQIVDIPALMRLKPHVLGFRGALCAGRVRTNALSADAVAAVRAEMDRHTAAQIGRLELRPAPGQT
jgi:(5-formylfuran-3-yl)methyl phosphate synthase